MALIWADFPGGQPGIYGIGSDSRLRMLDGTPWTQLSDLSRIINDPDPNVPSGSACLRVRSGTNNNPFVNPGAVFTFPNPVNGKVWVAARVWFDSFSVSDREKLFVFASLTNPTTTAYYVRREYNGALSLVRRDDFNETVLASTSGPVFTTSAWTHFSFEINPVTGVYSMRREDRVIFSGTDPNPVGFTVGFFMATSQEGIAAIGNAFYFKDFCIGDGTGTENTTHPGTVIVYDIRPNGDDGLGGWTTSSGSTGWNLLNESTPGDNGYVSAGTPVPTPCQFHMTNLPPDVSSVRGLISIVRARKTDGGDGDLQVSVTPNGTDYAVGANRAITTAQTYWFDVSEISPATTVRYTPVEVNNLRLRLNRTL